MQHQSSASLAFVWEIYRWPVNSPHKGPVTQKMFPFDIVIMFGWTKIEKQNKTVFLAGLFPQPCECIVIDGSLLNPVPPNANVSACGALIK